MALTEAQFAELSLIDGWSIQEIARQHWPSIPGLPRLQDTVAIMGSAAMSDPRLLNGIEAVAGLDQLVWEANPKPGEPEGNAYHFVVQVVNRSDFPYVLHGPFRSETKTGHWFTADDLDVYWPDPET